MRLLALAAATLITAGIGVMPSAANARPGWHGNHHGYHHRRQRVCRVVWSHHHRVRRCTWR